MKAGDLRETITLLVPGKRVINSQGRPVTGWVPLMDCQAKVSDVSSRDFYVAQAYQAQDTVTFSIRWVQGLEKPLRVAFDGATYDVEEINHLGYRRDFMQLKTKEVKGKGA